MALLLFPTAARNSSISQMRPATPSSDARSICSNCSLLTFSVPFMKAGSGRSFKDHVPIFSIWEEQVNSYLGGSLKDKADERRVWHLRDSGRAERWVRTEARGLRLLANDKNGLTVAPEELGLLYLEMRRGCFRPHCGLRGAGYASSMPVFWQNACICSYSGNPPPLIFHALDTKAACSDETVRT